MKHTVPNGEVGRRPSVGLRIRTMGGRGWGSIHVSARVRNAWGGERRVVAALGIQAIASILRIVLSHGQSSWNDFGLLTIAPTRLVVVRVILTYGLLSLKFSSVEDLLRIAQRLPLDDDGNRHCHLKPDAVYRGILGPTC